MINAFALRKCSELVKDKKYKGKKQKINIRLYFSSKNEQKLECLEISSVFSLSHNCFAILKVGYTSLMMFICFK